MRAPFDENSGACSRMPCRILPALRAALCGARSDPDLDSRRAAARSRREATTAEPRASPATAARREQRDRSAFSAHGQAPPRRRAAPRVNAATPASRMRAAAASGASCAPPPRRERRVGQEQPPRTRMTFAGRMCRSAQAVTSAATRSEIGRRNSSRHARRRSRPSSNATPRPREKPRPRIAASFAAHRSVCRLRAPLRLELNLRVTSSPTAIRLLTRSPSSSSMPRSGEARIRATGPASEDAESASTRRLPWRDDAGAPRRHRRSRRAVRLPVFRQRSWSRTSYQVCGPPAHQIRKESSMKIALLRYASSVAGS